MGGFERFESTYRSQALQLRGGGTRWVWVGMVLINENDLAKLTKIAGGKAVEGGVEVGYR